MRRAECPQMGKACLLKASLLIIRIALDLILFASFFLSRRKMKSFLFKEIKAI